MGMQIGYFTRRFGVILSLIGAVTLGVAVTDVSAQGRGGGFAGFGGGQQGSSYYLERDLPFFVQYLGLDSPQRLVLELAMSDYLAAHGQATEQMREQFQEMRPQRTDADREAMQAARENMQQVGREMREVAQAIRELQQQIEQSPRRNDRAESMLAQLQSRMENLQAEMNEARGSGFNRNNWQQTAETMAGVFETYQQERQRIEQQFEADVKALLNDEQFGRWEQFEQFMRRQKTLPLGRLSGERIDLFNLVRDLEIDIENSERDVQSLLDEYARQLDSALKRRNDFLEEAASQLRELMQSQDIDAAMAMARQEAAVRTRVRDVNRTFADLIASSMSDRSLAEQFTARFNAQAYTRIYRPTNTQRSFEVARELENLSDDVRNAIESLEVTYQSEIETHNRGLTRLLIDQEPRDITVRVEQMASRFAGERFVAPSNPVNEAFERRNSVDEMYRGILEDLLTPEQVAQLPEQRRPRGERQRGGRPGGDANDNRRGRGDGNANRGGNRRGRGGGNNE